MIFIHNILEDKSTQNVPYLFYMYLNTVIIIQIKKVLKLKGNITSEAWRTF